MHCTYKALLNGAFITTPSRAATLPPSFLLPALSRTTVATFSTTTSCSARKDGNPARSISPLHRSGQNKKQKLSVKLENLPKPVLDPARRSKVQVDEDHGLWEFFNAARTSLSTPANLVAHGRAWTVPELRAKDWDDLHCLWWTCLKERNRIYTQLQEIDRIKKANQTDLYGEHECNTRKEVVWKTMKNVRFVLTERWYAWENARQAAMEDDEVDLYADPEKGDKAYLPMGVSEEPLSLGSEDYHRTDLKRDLPPPNVSNPPGEARA